MSSPQRRSKLERVLDLGDHPVFNIAVLAWGLLVAIAGATYRNDVYLIAKAGEIVALALGQLLIRRSLRFFFHGLIATALAIPVAFYTTTPIFWGEFLPVPSQEFLELLLLGTLCALPLLGIGIWGLRWISTREESPKPDPAWFRWLSHVFKWTLAGMVLSFHLANPPLIILGILVFLGGMTCLAVVRLNLTRRHAGNFLLLTGAGTIVVAFLLIPLGIAHVSPAEASLAAFPALALVILGLILRRR